MLIKPESAQLEQLVRMALAEDAPWGDVTTTALIPPATRVQAHFIARESGVMCGEDIVALTLSLCGAETTTSYIHDGERFNAGDVLATCTGSAHAVLRAERVALNFVQRLCGIATLTAQYVAAVQGTHARIVDTRKTTPGLRAIERYAVRCGGGNNHRFSLSDAFLAKDNHLALIDSATLSASLQAARAALPHTTHFEVEVDRLDQIDAVLAAGAAGANSVDTIMLDNFTLDQMRSAVEKIAGRALIEASGGVTLDHVAAIAATGVDLISVGALTHSVRSLDIGLDIIQA